MRRHLLMVAALALLGACSSDVPPPSPARDGGGDPCAKGACEDGAPDAQRAADGAPRVDAPPNNVLVSDPDGASVSDLHRGADFLYWRGGVNRIVRAPTSGGTATTLFTHPQNGSSIQIY